MIVLTFIATILINIATDKAVDIAVDAATEKVIKVYEDHKKQKEDERAGP